MTKKRVRCFGVDYFWDDLGPEEFANWELVTDDSYDFSFWMDDKVTSARKDNKPKYAFLYEPISIRPNCYNYMKDCINKNEIFEGLFTTNRDYSSYSKKFHAVMPAFPPWVSDRRIHEKKSAVSMITTDKMLCREHEVRYALGKRLQKQPCGVNVMGRGFEFIEKKEEGLCDYAFSVAVENDWNDLYFTEKLLDCFLTGTIPIYLGCPGVKEIFDPEGMIFLDQKTVSKEVINNEIYNLDLYHSKMEHVKNNFEIATKIAGECHIKQRLNQIIEDYIL